MKTIYILAMDCVYRLCIWLSGISLLFMTFIYLVGIYARFRPDFPKWLSFLPYGSTSWPEPLSLICMITFSFVGAAAAYRAGGHIAITMLADRVPATIKKGIDLFVNIAMLIICVFIIRWGVLGCMDAWYDIVPSLPFLTSGMTHIPIPIGSFFTLLFVLERILYGSQADRELVQFGSTTIGH
ncbi:TRAP transporter small permease subunit [Acerihabitans sp. TG2]|uniref:TRAP transporter small permease n=1 Tax=Acerihabitans sp. TG2 TaxID=3096008 RepID=UPI002B23D0B5|nr:TRAP transporter small permease subunit [Acerihabitans sp. TG2]MEA9392125.1 TRAP transporter small permease subunit [Acerihabitans sp. TG2]